METTDAEEALRAGSRFGNWKIVRLLGRGGMADVYEVEDTDLGVRYALKLFTYARTEKEAVRARFFSEGRLLAKLNHPRLVRVYAMGEDEGTGRPYFVMDLVVAPDGRPRTLADVEAPDEEQVAMWYEDLRDGLAYIHDKGILHRDLKLQNVLVGPDGHVVLSDFGVAKIFDSALCKDLGVSAEQTLIAEKSGRKTVMGSVGYMAPEIEMGVAASKQSDWYALGVLVFRLLTGVWCDARTDVTGDLETYNPTWLKILPKLLHANPSGRECPSWRELETARREEDAYQTEKIYGEARDKLRRAKKTKKWLIAVLAVLTVLGAMGLVGGAVWWRLYRLPPFEALCAIPAGALRSDAADADDNYDGPTREEYEIAQADAWFLTHRLLAGVAAGAETRAGAAMAVRALAKRAENEEDDIFRNEDYAPGEDWPLLAEMLNNMADRMDGGAGR